MSVSTKSLWLEQKSKIKYPKLDKNIEVDVAIVGGGITGVTASYILSKTNLKVALFEKDKISSGATGWTTAMITQYIDTDLATLVDSFGIQTTKNIWDSGRLALDTIDRIVKKEKIDCKFKLVPYFIYGTNKKQQKALLEEQKTAKRLGIKFNVDTVGDILQIEIPNQAKFHPVLYLDALVQRAQKNCVDIYEDTEVIEIDKNNKMLKTKNGTVKAKKVIIATYEPFSPPLSLYFKKGTYLTYMIIADLPKGVLKEALYQDLQNPYHYYRVDSLKNKDRIILGGEDHRSQIPVKTEKIFKALEDYLRTILKGEKYSITHRWSGHILEPIDGLPSIGSFDNPDILYATGFSGTGMTYGTLAALILSDNVCGKKNKYYDVFKASRHLNTKALLHKMYDYTEEFFGGALKNFLR